MAALGRCERRMRKNNGFSLRNIISSAVICLFTTLLVSKPCVGKKAESETPPRLDELVLTVEHGLSIDGDSSFKPRGTISLRSLKNSHGAYIQKEQLTREELDTLKDMAKRNLHYTIRVPSQFGISSSESYVTTYVKACSLYESNLTELITLSVDHLGYVYGVGLRPLVAGCSDKAYKPGFDGVTPFFNTTVQILYQSNGPLPDTQTYVQRMEKEKRDQAGGKGKDNRSFLAKYWMYIVPIVIFMLMSSQQPDQQGEGEGGGS